MLQKSVVAFGRLSRFNRLAFTSNCSPMLLKSSSFAATRMTSQMIFGQTPMRGFAYHENVLDHYENPRNVGTLDKKKQNVGTGLVGAPACGDVMKLQIQVDEETGTIDKAVFKTFGCGSAIASSSYATEILEGMKLEEAVQIKNQDIASHLKLPPVKLHCSMLAEEAIQAAISDYKKKNEGKNQD